MVVEAEESPAEPKSDYSGLWILLTLAAVEVALLYVLIAVDTPATPLVRRLMRNPFGVFSLVMGVVTLLCFGMAFLLATRERAARSGAARPSNEKL